MQESQNQKVHLGSKIPQKKENQEKEVFSQNYENP